MSVADKGGYCTNFSASCSLECIRLVKTQKKLGKCEGQITCYEDIILKTMWNDTKMYSFGMRKLHGLLIAYNSKIISHLFDLELSIWLLVQIFSVIIFSVVPRLCLSFPWDDSI